MRIAIIFAGLMMLVIGPRRRQFFQPLADIVDQPALQVIYINRRCYMHRRYKTETVLHAAPPDNLFDLIGDVNHLASLFCFENQIFGVALHVLLHDCCSSRSICPPFILMTAVTASDPPTAESHLQYGLDLLATGKPTEAAQSFRAAIAADPTHYEAHHGLIRALRDAGRLEQSIGAALALTALTPSDPLAHAALSISLQHAGHIAEAEAAATRARILEWKVQLQSPPGEGSSL